MQEDILKNIHSKYSFDKLLLKFKKEENNTWHENENI